MCIVRGLRQYDFFAVKLRLLEIDHAVERRVLLACDALTSLQHRVKGLARMVCKPLPLVQRGDLQPIVQQEVQGVAQCHGMPADFVLRFVLRH